MVTADKHNLKITDGGLISRFHIGNVISKGFHGKLINQLPAVHRSKQLCTTAHHFWNGIHVKMIKMGVRTNHHVKVQIIRFQNMGKQSLKAWVPFHFFYTLRQVKVNGKQLTAVAFHNKSGLSNRKNACFFRFKNFRCKIIHVTIFLAFS